MRVVRCVLPHTQRCHESKACTSPATALYFPSKQTATATAGGWCASVEQADTGGEGRRRGRAVIHILPPLFVARLCDTAGRRSPVQHKRGKEGRAVPASQHARHEARQGPCTPPSRPPPLPSLISPPPVSSPAVAPGDARCLKLMTTVTQDNDAHGDSENGRQAVHIRYWLLVCGVVV